VWVVCRGRASVLRGLTVDVQYHGFHLLAALAGDRDRGLCLDSDSRAVKLLRIQH